MSADVDSVVPLDIGCVPELAVPGPIVMLGDEQAIFSFNACRLVPDGRREDVGRAVVRVPACLATKFGYPGSDDLPEHPLHSRGLEGIAVYEVRHSSWLRSLDSSGRFGCRHLIFPFHDSILELLCPEIEVGYTDKTSIELFAEMAAWVNTYH